MIAVVFEDRDTCLTGALIAAGSLRLHCPDLKIVLWAPGLVDDLGAWGDGLGIALRGDRPPLEGWNIKPGVLLELLQYEPVVYWLDSDILVTSDVRACLPNDPDIFIGTQDTSWGQRPGSAERRTAWGLPLGRDLADTVNTGFLRVSRAHIPLLTGWGAMLASDVYQDAQRRPVTERPLHLLGDQEALTALLGSRSERAQQVHLLSRGWDIAQCFGPDGFTWRERLTASRHGHVPPLIHAMGMKPWIHPRRHGLRAWYDRLHLYLSPYVDLACQQPDVVEAAGWSPRGSRLGRIYKGLVRDPLLQELPLCLIDAIVRGARRRWGIGRFQVDDQVP